MAVVCIFLRRLQKNGALGKRSCVAAAWGATELRGESVFSDTIPQEKMGLGSSNSGEGFCLAAVESGHL